MEQAPPIISIAPQASSPANEEMKLATWLAARRPNKFVIVFDYDSTLAFHNTPKLLPHVLRILQHAKRLQVPLYILSRNLNAPLLAEQAGIARFFTGIIGRKGVSKLDTWRTHTTIDPKDVILFDNNSHLVEQFRQAGGFGIEVARGDPRQAWNKFVTYGRLGDELVVARRPRRASPYFGFCCTEDYSYW